MDIILQFFWINLILFLHFNTDVIYQYLKITKLDLFKIKEFENYKLENPKADYYSYLRIKHKNFFVNLFTCKPCFLFWICLLICIIYSSLILFPVIYLTSYIIYKTLDKHVY